MAGSESDEVEEGNNGCPVSDGDEEDEICTTCCSSSEEGGPGLLSTSPSSRREGAGTALMAASNFGTET